MPVPTIVTLFPETVATAVLLDVNTKVPVLLVDGVGIEKIGSPSVLSTLLKVPKVGLMRVAP